MNINTRDYHARAWGDRERYEFAALDRDVYRSYFRRVSGFTKLHGSIIHSSVWATAYHVRVVWITMLAMADENGLVSASIGGMAKAAGVTRRECIESLELFMAPDADSRTKDHEGRRIEELPGGWLLINHAQYRDRRTDAQIKAAARAKVYRQRRRERLERDSRLDEPPGHCDSTDSPSPCDDESRGDEAESRDVTTVTVYPTEAEAEAEAEFSERVPDTKKRPTRNPEPVHSVDSMQAAQCLIDAIRSHKPDFKSGMQPARLEALLMSWAKDIDVGMRNDGMTLQGCEEAISAAHRSDDTFWRGNLLSGKKLRKHYESLRIRSSGPQAKPAALPDGFDFAAFGEEMGLGG